MFGVLFIFSLLSSVHSQNIAYDCTSDQSNYTTISLLDVGECIFNKDDIIEEKTEIQLLQVKESTNIPIYSCMINLQYHVLRCGMHSHNSLVKGGIVSENYRVTPDECKAMHSLRRARVYGQEYLIENFNETVTRWITLAGGIDADGTCTGASFHNHYGSYYNVVVHGQLTMMFSTGEASRVLKEDKIRLNSGIVCRSDSRTCIDSTFGYTFWDVDSFYTCSNDAYHVVYEGHATKVKTALTHGISQELTYSVMFSVKSPEQIFTLSTIGTKHLCHFTVYQTEHPNYLIMEVKNGNSYFAKKPIPTNDLDIFIYVNAKVIHVTHGIERAMRNMYETLSTEICD